MLRVPCSIQRHMICNTVAFCSVSCKYGSQNQEKAMATLCWLPCLALGQITGSLDVCLHVIKVCKNCHLNHETSRNFMVRGKSLLNFSHITLHLQYACMYVFLIFCLCLAAKMYHLSVWESHTCICFI